MRRKPRPVVHVITPILSIVATSAAADPIVFDWSGAYVGYHSGGALGLVDVEDPYGGSIFGDTVRTPGLLAGGQAGYNWQLNSAVLGLEADASWADMEGTNTCFAFSGFYISSNCRTHIDALGTLAGRLGFTLPSDDRTLLYGKAGLAWAHMNADATPNGGFGFPTTNTDGFAWGWTLGGGAERAIAPRWSLKAEYDFLSFDDEGFSAAASAFQPAPTPTPLAMPGNVSGAATSITQDIHQFKIGMNYRIDADGVSPDGNWLEALHPGGPAPSAPRTEIEAGVRYVHGWGQFHKDLGVMSLASLASRLTYDGTGTNGAELYARLDTAFDVVIKGVVGAGTGGGHMNDEDWGLPSPPFPAFVPYSNTLSDVDDDIRYVVVDVGYDWWRGVDYKITPFIGYSYFWQSMSALGCAQIANPNSDCVPALPTSVLGITEHDRWNALRLGMAVEVPLIQRLSLDAEAAYLPYVSFTGTDDHVLRRLVSPEEGNGIGMQLEAMLSYAVTDALSVGVGGRYWAMWTTSGNVNFGGTGVFVPMRYAAEQAHLLIEGSYKFDAMPSP
jgi:opacity protein-like surface antigen